MPTLNWIGKEAVVNHHHQVPRSPVSLELDGPKVIYCAGCLLGREDLQRQNIVVRQTPYEIRVS